MRRKKDKAHWLIEGFDGDGKIYETRVPHGQLTTAQAKALIRALAAKAGLTFDEIVGAYVKRRTRTANVHLDVHRDGPFPVFWCGNQPCFVISARNRRGVIFGLDNPHLRKFLGPQRS
jgi:hypothetical protein